MAINKLLFLLAIIATQFCQAQQLWVVRFTDKNNSPYSVSNPSQFLSQKAIERRTKHNISITQEDIPVNQVYIDSVLAKGATYINRSKWMNWVQVKVTDTTIMPSFLSLPFVSSVEVVNRFDTILGAKKSSKLDFETTQSLDYGFGNDQIKIMQGDFLHDSGYLGEGMTIAILDAGFTNVNSIPAFNHLCN